VIWIKEQCTFNISKEELETFNKQVETGIDPSAYGYDDALAAATINTKGLVADSVSEAAGTVTKEFFSGKFNIMETGGQESLVQKAKDTVARLQSNNISGSQLATAQNHLAAEQSVLDAVNVAKAATSSTSEVASAASEAASQALQEVTSIAQSAAQEVAEEVRATQNVNQIVRNADGSYSSIVGRTGVNVSHGQTVVWSGLTSASATSAQRALDGQRAIAEAAAASGLDLSGTTNPASGNSGCQGNGESDC
jgi:hypothetical protein